MIEEHHKTKILPPALHLTTADGSSMSSYGKGTLHLCISNFEFSLSFIICDKLPETDILLGIDLQKRFSQLYCWDSGKQLFIQRGDSFLTCTRNCEQQHKMAVVKSTLKIPPRHNGILPMRIDGHNVKDHVAYFISNQHTNKGLDTNIHVIDGIYNIKGRSTLHVLVASYTNKHVTFNKGQWIGHMEPSIDHMPQTSLNSLTIHKMLDENVQPDTLTLPLHTLPVIWGNHWINCWRHLNHNLHRMKQVLAQCIWQKCKLIQQLWSCLTEAISHCHETVWLDKEWKKKHTPWCTSNLQQPFKLVSAYYCGIQGQWRKTPSHWLQVYEPSHMEVYVAHAKGWRHFL